MAAKLPILNVPAIAQPCTESWEQMPGSARVRHCATCDQDVVNLAALSSAEIATLLQGKLPCLRVARFEDGTLVTTEPPTAHPLPRIAAGLLTAAVSLASAAQQSTTPPPNQAPQQTQNQAPQQTQNGRPMTATLGVPPLATVAISGRIVDAHGRPVPHLHLRLLERDQQILSLPVPDDGNFSFNSPYGFHDLIVEGEGITPQKVSFETGKPLRLPTITVSKAPPAKATPQPRQPAQSVTLGRIARPVAPTKPPAPASKVVPAQPSSVQMGSVDVVSESGQISIETSPTGLLPPAR